MTVECYLRRACESTGLDDFGPDNFLAGLAVAAASADSHVPAEKRAELDDRWVGYLADRLRLVQERKRRPDIASAAITRPILLTGLPRSGLTGLADLLAQDPANRMVRQWESKNLFPPPEPGRWRDDPRAAAMDEQFAATKDTDPLQKLKLHQLGAWLPEEDAAFMVLGFWGPNIAARVHLPEYMSWAAEHVPDRPFDVHRWVIQHLDAHGPSGAWIFKSQAHMLAIGQLIEEYPDLGIVQTHRDPGKFVVSNAGMLSILRGQEIGTEASRATGRQQGEYWGRALERFVRAREDPSVDARVLDVTHRDVVSDPLGTVRRIYERFDRPWTAEAEAGMKGWLAAPAQQESAMKFTPEDFGLTPAEIDAPFALYRERFGHLV